MTSENREELISAYVDDELSIEDRARVETWLAESADLRRLYDDLRQLRVRMQALPRHKLDRDLSDAVLRRSERAVLGGDHRPSKAANITPGSLVADWWSRGRGWRRLVWPAVAVAAALVIALFDTQQKPAEREVARTTLPSETSIGARNEAAPLSAGAKDAGNSRSADEEAKEFPAADASPAPKIFLKSAEPRDMRADFESSGKADAPAAAEMRKKGMEHQGRAAAEFEFVEADVPENFIRERQLERLLDAKKIVWNRLDEKDADVKRRASAAGRSLDKAGEEPQLIVEIPNIAPEQLNEVVTTLEKQQAQTNSSRAVQTNKSLDAFRSQSKLEDGYRANQLNRQKLSNQSLMIRLRGINNAPAAPAAKP